MEPKIQRGPIPEPKPTTREACSRSDPEPSTENRAHQVLDEMPDRALVGHHRATPGASRTTSAPARQHPAHHLVATNFPGHFLVATNFHRTPSSHPRTRPRQRPLSPITADAHQLFDEMRTRRFSNISAPAIHFLGNPCPTRVRAASEPCRPLPSRVQTDTSRCRAATVLVPEPCPSHCRSR